MSTPLSRYVGWYEALAPDLRSHLAAHLFAPGLPELDGGAFGAPRARATTIRRMAGQPSIEAELALRLAVRTDAVLADPAVRDAWIAGGPPIARTMEWMRALEEWGALRVSSLAGRRIERWLAKRASGTMPRVSDRS